MKITQIRNACQIIDYAGARFLVDPMLAEKDRFPAFEGCANPHLRNPIVELPMDIKTILKDVDAVIVTHTHPDHWDEVAAEVVNKDLPIFVQNDEDQKMIRSQGFRSVTIMPETGIKYRDVELSKVACGKHGTKRHYSNPQMAELLGEAMGVIFRHTSEKTIFLAGDTVWTSEIEKAMQASQPGVIILNLGWAHVIGFGPIIMGQEDALKAHFAVPDATVVATHLEAVNHCLQTRAALRDYVHANEIDEFVSIPEDGETVVI